MDIRTTPIFQDLISIDLPPDDYVVFGSGPLFAHGLKPSVRDLDVLARGEAWDIACRLGDVVRPPSGNGRMVLLCDGRIEVLDSWVSPVWNVDELIESAEVIAGIPFVPLTTVLAWKEQAGREKDARDIALLRAHLGG